MNIEIKFKIKKEYILYFSLSFILIVSFLSLKTLVNANKTFDFGNNTIINEDLENIKNELLSIEDSNCKKFINEYIEIIENNKIDGVYPLSHLYFYNSNYNILSLFEDGNNKCNIEESDKKKIAINYLSIMTNRSAVTLPYLYQYEIGFKTRYNNEIMKNTTSLSYLSLKNNEIDLLKKYMEFLRKEDNNE